MWIRLSLTAAAMCVLYACGGQRNAAELLPAEVNGGWKLERTEERALDSLPPEVRERSPRRAIRGFYTGPVPVSLTMAVMPGQTSAFAVVQSWRPREGSQVLYRGPYLVIAESTDAPRDALIAFVRALEPKLPE